MGLFDIFNPNKKRWLAIINNNEVPQEFEQVIHDFLIKDNILFEKFVENQRANEIVESSIGGIELWESVNNGLSQNPEPPIKCTPTFRAHFAHDTLNRGLEVPSWFYVAYPDVAFWFQKNTDNLEKELDSLEGILFDESGLKLSFFRFIIDKYQKQTGMSLECKAQ